MNTLTHDQRQAELWHIHDLPETRRKCDKMVAKRGNHRKQCSTKGRIDYDAEEYRERQRRYWKRRYKREALDRKTEQGR